VAHEISHSWTGNLVSNVSWGHFWLNEGWEMVDDMVDGGFDKYDLIIYHYLNWEIGWTVWLERKIMSKIKNDPSYEYFSASIGYKVRDVR